jgi:hypothetical protein
MSSSGHAGFEGDPTAVSTHDLNHHHAMVRCSRGMDFVDGNGVQSSVESEGHVRRREIVVDRWSWERQRSSSPSGKVRGRFSVSRRRRC